MQSLVSAYGRDFLTHLLVSSLILGIAVAAAAWIRPLTARTRHAILIAGMAALVFPPGIIRYAVERLDSETIQPFRAALPAFPNAGPAPAAPEPSAFPWVELLVAAWLAIALVLLVRWWIVTRRLVMTAMRAATPPPARAVAALEAVRLRLGLRHSVDLIASPTCEAPAVVRVLRPMIILPADGCDSLGDDELQALLCHECAHVARRDNLLGVLEAVACSLFWFNPLVWLAHRRIAAAREEACDERVADAALPAETYVGALAKICRSLLAPRVAAVSCMASAHLKERIQHLMRYDTLRTSALSHRFISAAASVAVALFIVAAGVVTADPINMKKSDERYLLNYSVSRMSNDTLAFRAEIVDNESKEVIGQPTVMTTGTTPATSEITRDNRKWRVDVTPHADGGGVIALTVWDGSKTAQRSSYTFAKLDVVEDRKYTGKPISMDLHNADLRDLLGTFGQLTGLKITIEPEVQGRVTVRFRDMPWDQAFDQIVRENGLDYRHTGKDELTVFKRKG